MSPAGVFLDWSVKASGNSRLNLFQKQNFRNKRELIVEKQTITGFMLGCFKIRPICRVYPHGLGTVALCHGLLKEGH